MGTDEAAPKKKIGRPKGHKRDEDMEQRICTLLLTEFGGLPAVLARLKKAGHKVPSHSQVFIWREVFPEFEQKYRRAQESHAYFALDEAYRISKEPMVGEILTVKKEKGRVVEETSKIIDNVERSKLLVQTLFRRAALFNPARFGEKIDLAVAGEIAVKRVVADL